MTVRVDSAPVERLVIAVAALLAAWTPPVARAESRVGIVTTDGVTIAGTYYESSRRPSPHVLLVSMPTRSRAEWSALATRLADRGVGVLAIDLRGSGDSGPATYTEAGAEDRGASLRDVQAAFAWLKQRPDGIPGALAIAGASLGANLAAMVAADEPTVRALVLLSPTEDFRGVRPAAAIKKYGPRPALLLSSREDGYATRSARELAAQGSGLRELRVEDGAGHGTTMLSRQPDLVSAVVDWLCSRLL